MYEFSTFERFTLLETHYAHLYERKYHPVRARSAQLNRLLEGPAAGNALASTFWFAKSSKKSAFRGACGRQCVSFPLLASKIPPCTSSAHLVRVQLKYPPKSAFGGPAAGNALAHLVRVQLKYHQNRSKVFRNVQKYLETYHQNRSK